MMPGVCTTLTPGTMKDGNRWTLMAVRRRDITMTACMMHVVICALLAPEEEVSQEGEHELGIVDCGEVEDPLDPHLQLHLACPSLSPFRVPVTTVVNMGIWQRIVKRRREIWPLAIISRIKLEMGVVCREDEESLLDGAECKR